MSRLKLPLKVHVRLSCMLGSKTNKNLKFIRTHNFYRHCLLYFISLFINLCGRLNLKCAVGKVIFTLIANCTDPDQ